MVWGFKSYLVMITPRPTAGTRENQVTFANPKSDREQTSIWRRTTWPIVVRSVKDIFACIGQHGWRRQTHLCYLRRVPSSGPVPEIQGATTTYGRHQTVRP